MATREPFIRERDGIDWWYYDFTCGGKRHRGWIAPVENKPKRQALADFKLVYANALTDTKSLQIRPVSKSAANVFKSYRDYIKTHKPKTWRGIKYIHRHWENFFGKKRVISSKDIVDYQKKMMNDGMSGPTINRHLQYCRAAFNKAGVSPNPFAKFDRFNEQDRIRYLNKVELKELLRAVVKSKNRQLKGIVLTAILTGMRKDEILNLHVRHIDFANNLITLPGSVRKGGKPNTVPLPPQLVLMFKRYLKDHASGYVFENTFSHSRFFDVRPSWPKAKEEAKLEDFRFHDLRHTFATYVTLASGNLRLVQELLGHASVKTTQKYAHVIADSKAEAILKLDRMLVDLLD